MRHPFPPSAKLVPLVLAPLVLLPAFAHAHHEAIFGPQSSLMLSAPGFVSAQAYTLNRGTADQSEQETTFLLSGGFTPFHDLPLSFALMLPFSYVDAHDDGGGHDHATGVEDALVGARYRFDFAGLNERLGSDQNFLMAMGGVELPTGTVDHDFWDGPVDWMGGLLGSVGAGRLSGIGYGFYRLNGEGDGGEQDGDKLFVGTGGAYTPIDEGGQLLSVQLGVTFEKYFAGEPAGTGSAGGNAVLVHPTVAYGPSEHWLAFAMVSLPVYRDYENPAEQDRFRLGVGIMYLFAHDHD